MFTCLGVIAAVVVLVIFFLVGCSAKALGGEWKFTEINPDAKDAP